MAYDVGEATLRIVPSLEGAIELIDAESRRWRSTAESNLRNLGVSFDLDTAAADAKLAEFRALAERNVETKVDVDRSKVDLAEHSVSNLTAALIGLGPAVVPIGAAFVGAFAGSAALLGSLAGGLGVVALGAKGVAHAVSDEVEPAFHRLQQTATQGLLPGVESAIQSLLTLTPQLDHFVGSLAHTIGGLAAEAGTALAGPFWQQFFSFIDGEAGPILTQFGHVIGNLAHGFAGLVEAFAPVTRQIGAGLEHLTAQFAHFGAEAAHSAGFSSFLHYIETEGPLVVHVFGDLAKAIGHILAALAPLGPVVLTAVDAFAKFISAIPSGVLLGFAAAASAVVVTLKLLVPVLAAFDTALAANPVVLITAAVVTFGLVLYEASQHSEQLAAALDDLTFGLAGDFFRGLTTAIHGVEALGHAMGGVKGIAEDLKKTLGVVVFGPGALLDKFLGPLGPGRLLNDVRNRIPGLAAGSVSVTGGFSKSTEQQIVSSFSGAAAAASKYSGALSLVSKNTKDAVKAAHDYSDALHALADPLFAENEALQDLKAKQSAYNKAVREHGKDSHAAKQALEDLASSSLNMAAASATLTASVKAHNTTMAKAKATLHTWVAASLITRGEAHRLAASWAGLIGKADGITKAVGKSAHNQAWGDLVSTVKKTVGDVESHFGTAASKVVKDGLNFAIGFASGISSGENPVLAAVHALVSAALAAVPKTQKSSSPSKITYTYGQHFGWGFASGITSTTNDAVAAATHLTARVLRAQAAAMVAGAIHRATLPDVTDPTVLRKMLGHASDAAVVARRQALIAHDIYRDLRDSAKDYDEQAKAADRAAAAAKRHADNMKAGTDAEKAAKKAAEDHAKSLAQLAKVADKTAREADRAAAHGQKTWQKLQEAADKATQKAVDDATHLVSTLTDQLDTLQQQVDDFTSQVTQGLTGDDSLSTLWGALVDKQATAAADLATAQQNLQAAQDAVTQAGTAATADQLQTLADAQNALTAAQAAADQANAGVSVTGIQGSLNTVLANAQQFATDLQTLIGEGATSALISQLVSMGPQAGDVLASQLVAAGPDSVAKLSATLDQISSYTQSAADQMAQTFYGGGVSAMEQFIEGLEKSFPELRSALTPILADLQDMFAGAAAAGPVFRGSPIIRGLPTSALTPATGGAAPMTVYAQFGEETIEARSVRVSNTVLDQRVAGAQHAVTAGTPGGVLGALSSPHAVAVSR